MLKSGKLMCIATAHILQEVSIMSVSISLSTGFKIVILQLVVRFNDNNVLSSDFQQHVNRTDVIYRGRH